MSKTIDDFEVKVDNMHEALEVAVEMEKTFNVDCSEFAIRSNDEGSLTVTYEPDPPQGE